MKKQIMVFFAGAIFLIGLASVLLFVRRERAMALHWLTENSRSQLDLMGDLLVSDLEHLKSQMARIATMMEAGQTEEAQKALGVFVGVAALESNSTEFLWKVQPESNSESRNDEWAAQWIQKLREITDPDPEVQFYATQSPDGKIRSALSVFASVRDRRSGQVRQVRLIGIVPKPLFQELLDKLKVQGLHLFLTGPQGLTMAHTVSEYVGNSMAGDRTYEEIRKQKNIFGSLVNKDNRGEEILSFFVKLPVGKLTLVSQWRKDLWVLTDWSYYGQSLVILLALSLLCGAVVHFLLNRWLMSAMLKTTSLSAPITSPTLNSTPNSTTTPASMPSAHTVLAPNHQPQPLLPPPPNPSTAPSALTTISAQPIPIPQRPSPFFQSGENTKEPLEPKVSLKVLDKVISALRAPLLSVLGHVQLARLNPQGNSLQAIETEVRSARDVLDQLGPYAGQAQIPSVTMPLYELVEAALRTIEGSLLRGSIKIIRELPPELAIKCDIDEFKSALAALIKNSVDAMEKSLRKTLTLKAAKQNGWIVLEIEDSGEGILPENLERIFEPFFTTRSSMEHQGLGLSMAVGILRQHGAQVQIQSKVGEGTQVHLKIPMSHEVVQSFSERGLTLRRTKDAKTPSLETLERLEWLDEVPIASGEVVEVSPEAIAPLDTVPLDRASAEKISDPLNLFGEEEEDSFGDFHFGQPMSFASSSSSQSPHLPPSPLLPEPSSERPSKKLKKKEEPLAKIKVQIPRPEERL